MKIILLLTLVIFYLPVLAQNNGEIVNFHYERTIYENGSFGGSLNLLGNRLFATKPSQVVEYLID